MNFHMKDESHIEDNDFKSNSPVFFKMIAIFIAVILAPSALIGIIIFFVFMRTLKWKPKITAIPLTIILMLLITFSSGPLSNLSLITNISRLKNNWKEIILSYIYISLIVGIVLGYVIILYKALDLKRYPEYTQIRGWAYGFKYKPTPFDNMRKKKNVESLQNGQEFDYEKSPIGVIEEPVKNGDLEGTLDMKSANKASIIYRYYTEAMAHTLITGKTGSGKALHIDTEIRCRNKGWTTVGEIEVGDIIYDESGNHTKVEAIYQPMTEDHYEITFDNGEVVKACGDHLWNIGHVNERNTVCTRDLLNNYSHNTKYFIKHSIDGMPLTHKILKIKKIKSKPEDYLCFTVDSSSRLFLITRSYIPTHNTVTMLSLIQNDILVGNPICVIDFKKSPDLIYFLSKWAKESEREFFHFVSGKPGSYKNPYKDDQSTYDPLSTGGATAKADMILNLRTWDTASEVFKKRTQDVLQSLFFLLERTSRQDVPEIDWDSGGMAQFVSALNLNNFKKMIELMAKDMQAGKLSAGDVRRYNTLIDLYKELSSKTKSDLRAQIVELLSIARTLIVSNYGDWLATGASKYHIDLMNIATSKDAPIVLFSFNQQEEPEFAQYIGSIVMSDLSRVSALKNARGDTTQFGVYIDEFQTLDPATVKDNLEKARSSKMYITLSLQSIDQIVSSAASQGEAMANSIIDTCANFIFHDGSGYDTAEKMSKIIGKTKRYEYKTTSKSNNRLIKYRLMSVDKAMVSKDVKEDWLIPPSEFQSLESPVKSNGFKATAYVINKSSDDPRFKRSGGALARKVHVVVAEETAQGVPTEFKREIFIPQGEDSEFQKIKSEIINEYSDESIEINNEDDGDWKIEDIEKDLINDMQPDAIKYEPKLSINDSDFAIKTQEVEINDELIDGEDISQLDIFKKLNVQKNKTSIDNLINNKKISKKSNDIVLPKLD
ncbi:MAG TPA: TraM recognition domain-containing protein [Clostridiales bacterium]|nr:TraM recognition domain-containing protein [Clostridiales bacterium]